MPFASKVSYARPKKKDPFSHHWSECFEWLTPNIGHLHLFLNQRHVLRRKLYLWNSLAKWQRSSLVGFLIFSMKRKQLFFSCWPAPFFLLPPPLKRRCSCKDDRFCFHVFTLLSWCPPFYEKRSTFEFFWPLPVTVVTFNWLPDPEGMAKCLPVRASFSQTMWESLNWELIAFWLHLSNSSAPIHTHKG